MVVDMKLRKNPKYTILHIALVAIIALLLSPNMIIFKKSLTIFFIFVTVSLHLVSSSTSASEVSFADHCASLPHDYSTPEENVGVNSSVHRLTGFYHTSDGSYIFGQTSGDEVQNTVVFRFWYDGAADEQGLFRVQGCLEFPPERLHYLVRNSISSQEPTYFRYKSLPYGQDSPSFKLNGIWSEASGELCMVGSCSYDSIHGNLLELRALLKLYKLKNSSSVTSLISGTLESLVSQKNEPNYFGPNYFEPISMSMFPTMNYQYTFALNKPHNSCSDEIHAPPRSLEFGESFCSLISDLVLMRDFELIYPSHCVSAKKCSPFSVSYLSSHMSLWNIECLEDTKRIRVLLDFLSGSFHQQRLFNPSTALIGEGSWDAEKNQLCIVACQILTAINSSNIATVGDCSTRVSYWVPAVWTLGNSSNIQGSVWSNKAATESDYFQKITFGVQREIEEYPLRGQEYEYTKIGKVKNLCQRKKTAHDNTIITYPHPFSYDMNFHVSAKKHTGEEIAWGILLPLNVGNQSYSPQENPIGSEVPAVGYTYNHSSPHNISYRIIITARVDVKLPNGFYILNSPAGNMVISAEGIYDDREGILCMVGCRDVRTNIYQQSTNESVDCEIFVKFEFPPTYPKSSVLRYINGSIKSIREKSDPLYFEGVEFTSAAVYNYDAERSIWRMDVEIILVLLSNTAACVFGASQLFHVERHPDVLPSISICMLYILGLGFAVPLVINFDAMLTPRSSQTLYLGSNGWLNFNDVVVNVIILVGLLVHIRLLQLARSARSTNGHQKGLWDVEKLALFVALSVYVAGSLVTLLLMNWREMDYIVEMVWDSGLYQGRDLLGAFLKACAGLMLNAFLLPQIVVNIFRKSKQNPLAAPFYVGATFVRVLPYAYDVYREYTSVQNQLDDSAIYASPATYVNTTAWNVMIACGCVLFAGIIYLQQRFGGCCILPRKLRVQFI